MIRRHVHGLYSFNKFVARLQRAKVSEDAPSVVRREGVSQLPWPPLDWRSSSGSWWKKAEWPIYNSVLLSLSNHI